MIGRVHCNEHDQDSCDNIGRVHYGGIILHGAVHYDRGWVGKEGLQFPRMVLFLLVAMNQMDLIFRNFQTFQFVNQ